MSTWESLRPQVRWPVRAEVGQCIAWLLFTLLGGLLPLWGTYLLTVVQNKHSALYEYVGRAEFALYAAATASAALFVVFRDLKAPFPFRSVLGLLSIALLAIAAILFASTFSSAPPTPENTPGSLNISALAWLSIMAFIASVVVAVIIFLIDLQVAEYDPRKVDEQQIEQLSKAVEKEA